MTQYWKAVIQKERVSAHVQIIQGFQWKGQQAGLLSCSSKYKALFSVSQNIKNDISMLCYCVLGGLRWMKELFKNNYIVHMLFGICLPKINHIYLQSFAPHKWGKENSAVTLLCCKLTLNSAIKTYVNVWAFVNGSLILFKFGCRWGVFQHPLFLKRVRKCSLSGNGKWIYILCWRNKGKESIILITQHREGTTERVFEIGILSNKSYA